MEADATTPHGTKQRRICQTKALTYMQTTPENRQNHVDMIEQQMLKSSEEKEATDCSEKDWWDVARDYLQDEKIGDNCFLTIVQANESGDLIAFNAYSCRNEKTICHYLYVRTDYRRQGIASRMLQQPGIKICVCTTRCGQTILAKMGRKKQLHLYPWKFYDRA